MGDIKILQKLARSYANLKIEQHRTIDLQGLSQPSAMIVPYTFFKNFAPRD